MNRHAYLVIIHNNFYNFEKLIQLLDDERNDIYVHVNKKVRNFDCNKYIQMCKKSKLIFSKRRVAVFWGSPLLLEAEMILLRLAYNSGNYSYFHLLSGADLPIKSMNYIYDFFEENLGNEFISFSDNMQDYLLQYYYPFYRIRQTARNKYIKEIGRQLNRRLYFIQKKIGINRLKRFKVLAKGSNWFSITNKFAKVCIHSYWNEYRKLFKYTVLPEENFMQMMVLSGGFREALHKDGNMRYIKWEGGDSPEPLDEKDYSNLIQSRCLFARKFDGDRKREIIDKIFEDRRSEDKKI